MVQLERWLQGGYFMWGNPVADRPHIACVKNINNVPTVLIWDGRSWRRALTPQANDQRWQTGERGINDCIEFNLENWNQQMGTGEPQPPDIYNDVGVVYGGGARGKSKKSKCIKRKSKRRKSRKRKSKRKSHKRKSRR